MMHKIALGFKFVIGAKNFKHKTRKYNSSYSILHYTVSICDSEPLK